jgi:hypothetical protein
MYVYVCVILRHLTYLKGLHDALGTLGISLVQLKTSTIRFKIDIQKQIESFVSLQEQSRNWM